MLPNEPGQSATVLVALAASAGIPSQTIAGNVRSVPPPAIELTAPPSRAARKTSRKPRKVTRARRRSRLELIQRQRVDLGLLARELHLPHAPSRSRCRARSSARSCVPRSMTRPSSISRIRSARRIVDSRCAMTNVVRPASSVGHRRLDQLLALGVEVARRLVEDQDLRRREDRARDRQPLLLAARQLHAALADERARSRSGSCSMNSCALARRAASSTSASVASCRP